MEKEPYEHPSFKAAKAAKEPWRTHFPKNTEEAKAWEPQSFIHSLAMKVLAVAQTRVEFGWAAYIDAVPGWNHIEEKEDVTRHGTKLPEKMARLLFPFLKDIPYCD